MNRVFTSELFDARLANLHDCRVKARIQARIRMAETGNLGDCHHVVEGIYEMRIHRRPGYRVYYIQRGSDQIIVLLGGNKCTQDRDVRTARELAKEA